MPPKKAAPSSSKKTEAKKKEKIIEVRNMEWNFLWLLMEFWSFVVVVVWINIHLYAYLQDKTFGLKNKKGAKNQKFIAQVEKQVKSGGIHPNRPLDPRKDEKEKKLQEQKEMQALFR